LAGNVSSWPVMGWVVRYRPLSGRSSIAKLTLWGGGPDFSRTSPLGHDPKIASRFRSHRTSLRHMASAKKSKAKTSKQPKAPGKPGKRAAAKPSKPAAAKPAKAAKASASKPGAKDGIGAGSRAPSFTLKDQSGKEVASSSLAGTPYVLYFYPKDDTTG